MTNRRAFLINAGIAPGVEGITPIPGTGYMQDQSNPGNHPENRWLNVNDCGVSGSKFETVAETKRGSRQITVADVGDFKVGQGVMVSKCNIRYTTTKLWGTGARYRNSKPLENSVDVRGYDGSAGSWMVYVLDIAPSSPPAFRWTDDLSHTWHQEVPITHDWQPLSGGVEVKLNKRDWESGYVIAFGARDQLISRIEKIEGNVLILQDEANSTVNNAVVRHNDTFALQEAIDRAIREKLNVYIPVGHYMLAKTIRVNKAQAITIEGASAVDTVLDISEGEGSCFSLVGGTEVIIRNFRMFGFMGFDERDKAGELETHGSTAIWGFALKHCNAVTISNTERVLIENCHASKMSGECFVSGGNSRGTVKPGQSYSQGITYLRCSVTNSARNAFNDVMCGTENTSVLNCRIVDVGGGSWEGASRFVKFIGNYMRNAGSIEMGNLGPANRDNTYPDLGAGQHIIADNVFDNNISYGGCTIRSSRGSTQVIIRNNLFINFNSSAVQAGGDSYPNEYLSANTIITGNIFDMTCIGQEPVSRTAISIRCNDAIVSDNQIYVRGHADIAVAAIRLFEPAINVDVHDNLVRNCGVGIYTGRGEAIVSEVVDNRTFVRSNWPSGLPLDLSQPRSCNGWNIVWHNGDKTGDATSCLESFDPETLRFRLREPHIMKVGDRLDVIAPSVNWNLHNNTLTDCQRPVVLDSYGSKTSIFRNNLVNRGNTSDVQVGLEIHGCFNLIDNRFINFDEDKSSALILYPDAIGRPCKSQFRGNQFEKCFKVLKESQPGLWKNAMTKDNLTIECVHKIPS